MFACCTDRFIRTADHFQLQCCLLGPLFDGWTKGATWRIIYIFVVVLYVMYNMFTMRGGGWGGGGGEGGGGGGGGEPKQKKTKIH